MAIGALVNIRANLRLFEREVEELIRKLDQSYKDKELLLNKITELENKIKTLENGKN